jgi:fatty-acyl-CoA synthase
MPTPKLIEALRRFGPILQQGYGSAEVLPPVTMLQPRQHMHGGEPAPRETLLSCGQVVPQVQIRVVDEDGRDVPAGEPGELLVKSPTVFGGYWKRPDLSAQSLVDGWLRIGDVGTLSSDGWLTVLGRKPDLLQRNGRVIYPRLVEEAVHEHPAVKEATYVQRPNGTVMAFSLRQEHRGRHPQRYWASELARQLQDRVPDWQKPDSYALFDELPRSRLGKVLRREVRGILASAPTPAQRAVEQERTSVV